MFVGTGLESLIIPLIGIKQYPFFTYLLAIWCLGQTEISKHICLNEIKF